MLPRVLVLLQSRFGEVLLVLVRRLVGLVRPIVGFGADFGFLPLSPKPYNPQPNPEALNPETLYSRSQKVGNLIASIPKSIS